MLKNLIIIFFLLFSSNAFPNENLLTIQQQLERLQREVSDLSQSVFSNQNNLSKNNDSNLVNNLSAIDMRIYDLEKDIKSLTGSIEEVFFLIEDLTLKINKFDEILASLENRILEVKQNSAEINDELSTNNLEVKEENTLGSLKITSGDTTNIDVENKESISDAADSKEKLLLPEDQFQLAFNNIRNKNWDEAKNSFKNFIEKFPDNQLSGSAHYWLGELYILEKQHREAALIFAEGYQKFPQSIKSPDMLFKLALSLNEVGKKDESCKTLNKFLSDYPKHKLVKKTKKQISSYGCSETNQ